MKRSSFLLAFVLLCGLSCVLQSCAVVRFQHIGASYAPTRQIDILYNDRDIKVAKYEFMGEILMETVASFILAEMQDEMVHEAQMRGADAIIIGDLDVRFGPDGSQMRVARGRLVKYVQ